MTLKNCLALLTVCVASACASAHPLGDDAGTGADAGTALDASHADVTDSRDATVDASDLAPSQTCVGDSDCNDDPAVSSLHGECVDGQCFCREGSWMQASGRCGSTAPTCTASGGTCRSSTEVGSGCLSVEGLRPVAASANEDCVAGGTGDVCCIEESACRSHPEFVDYCYVRGSDAAYVPPCTNGWLTCAPGDSPALRIGS